MGNWEIWHKSGLYLQSDTIYYSPHVHIITSGYIPANLEGEFTIKKDLSLKLLELLVLLIYVRIIRITCTLFFLHIADMPENLNLIRYYGMSGTCFPCEK